MLEVRKHWGALLGPGAQTVGVILAALVVGFVTSPVDGSDPFDTVAGIAAIAAAVRFVYLLVEWRLDRVVVTDHRIVEVSGLLTRRVASMPLIKVTDMTYRRSPLARLLGYGELVLESAGQRQALDRIDHLPYPDDFYRSVTWLVNRSATPEEPDPDRVDTGPLPRTPVL